MSRMLLGMFLIMFGLKLGGFADLSWFVVTAPLWVPVSVAVALHAVVAVLESISGSDKNDKKK